MRVLPLALMAIALTGPAMAQTAYESPREANALRDIARAQNGRPMSFGASGRLNRIGPARRTETAGTRPR